MRLPGDAAELGKPPTGGLVLQQKRIERLRRNMRRQRQRQHQPLCPAERQRVHQLAIRSGGAGQAGRVRRFARCPARAVLAEARRNDGLQPREFGGDHVARRPGAWLTR